MAGWVWHNGKVVSVYVVLQIHAPIMFGKVFPGYIWEWTGSLIFVIKHEGEFPAFYDWKVVAFTTSLENI